MASVQFVLLAVLVGFLPVKGNNPVILIPGLGGCQIEARVYVDGKEEEYCTGRTNTYRLLWLNPALMLPFVVDCLDNMMKLTRDPVTGMTSNAPGVHVNVPGWGDTESVEWLSPIRLEPFSYYFTLVDGLVNRRRYRRGVNIRGAPFDFRKAPNEMAQYFIDLKSLIEETFRSNGYRPVVLAAHSLGASVTLHFLQRQSQMWKDIHIKSFVSINGAYAGATTTVKAMATGANMGIPTIEPNSVRGHQRTLPSTSYLMPKSPAWGPNDVVAITDARNYTISDYDAFLRDIGYPEAIPMMKDVLHVTDIRTGPGVPMHCLMIRNTPTEEIFDWRGRKWPDDEPMAHYGEGDGTVNWKSLALCPEFAKTQSQPVVSKLFEDTTHSKLLRDQRLVKYFVESVL